MHSQRLTSYRGNYEVRVTTCHIVLGSDQLVLRRVMQTFVQTKTERLKNQQREYEAQMQYRQHLQVCTIFMVCTNIVFMMINNYSMLI